MHSLFHFRNKKKVTSAKSMEEIKKATVRLLRTIVVLTQTLSSLPDKVYMTMKLLYYDESKYYLIIYILGSFIEYVASFCLIPVLFDKIYSTATPADYEPPGFHAAEKGSFVFESEPMNIKVGDVYTVSILLFIPLKF